MVAVYPRRNDEPGGFDRTLVTVSAGRYQRCVQREITIGSGRGGYVIYPAAGIDAPALALLGKPLVFVEQI